MELTPEETTRFYELLKKAKWIDSNRWKDDTLEQIVGDDTATRIVFSGSCHSNCYDWNEATEFRWLLLKMCGKENAIEKGKNYNSDVPGGTSFEFLLPQEYHDCVKELDRERDEERYKHLRYDHARLGEIRTFIYNALANAARKHGFTEKMIKEFIHPEETNGLKEGRPEGYHGWVDERLHQLVEMSLRQLDAYWRCSPYINDCWENYNRQYKLLYRWGWQMELNLNSDLKENYVSRDAIQACDEMLYSIKLIIAYACEKYKHQPLKRKPLGSFWIRHALKKYVHL